MSYKGSEKVSKKRRYRRDATDRLEKVTNRNAT